MKSQKALSSQRVSFVRWDEWPAFRFFFFERDEDGETQRRLHARTLCNEEELARARENMMSDTREHALMCGSASRGAWSHPARSTHHDYRSAKEKQIY